MAENIDIAADLAGGYVRILAYPPLRLHLFGPSDADRREMAISPLGTKRSMHECEHERRRKKHFVYERYQLRPQSRCEVCLFNREIDSD